MNVKQVIQNETVDLINKYQEQIHLSGHIQPHGVLFVLKEPELIILQVSNNTFELFDIPAKTLLNQNLSCFLDKKQINSLRKSLENHPELKTINPVKLSVKTKDKSLVFDGIIHRSEKFLILELEPAISEESISFFNFYHSVREAASKMQDASDLKNLCQIIVEEIRKITSFDRVMVYKFDSQYNGAVIAEDKIETLESLLGLNYPSLDIPPQARELYTRNWLRVIRDVNYQPVKIIPVNNQITHQPIDLTLSVLRSVSPCHRQYLKKMGLTATMCISLMKNKKLWGLIACHHISPKYVPYELRAACEFLGQTMSLELAYKENHEDYDYQLELKSLKSQIIEEISTSENFIDALVECQNKLLNLVSAEGAIIVSGNNLQSVGKTPPLITVEKLISWLEKKFNQELFYTDSLPKVYQEFEKYKDIASGLLALSISSAQRIYILWFRPEVIRTVNWAGDPAPITEAESNGNIKFCPRKSFELWKGVVKLTSRPWKECEINVALELRNAIIKIVLKQADELAKLNSALQKSEAGEREKAAQLKRTLKRLQLTQTQLIQSEKMSSLGQLVAGIAHEINNPINFIYANIKYADNYANELMYLIKLYQKHCNPSPEIKQESEKIDLEFILEDLPQLLKSMEVGTERIYEIVKSLRNFSRLDQAEMKPVNIHEGIESTLLILNNRLDPKVGKKINLIKEYGNLPQIYCYVSQLNQVFMNILVNGIDALEEAIAKGKFSESNEQQIPTIKIQTKVVGKNLITITISDNGIGIKDGVLNKIFDPFFTTKPVGKGTGIGLAISYQIIVDKHGGRIFCNSQEGKGTEFIIEIPSQNNIRKFKTL
ncbi:MULTISPECIES: ATP-binding protein [Okeania]|uniref:histidine kinase n=1 Tax=Okeania hirsuta TaxID=1458930 RepID=A0A3N6Q2M8_9CYAN|nr:MULTISPECIES: ATP-binding protein [Okeania]NET14322.1 GAF domain-containing protein [Okeania sp. SIO1H6]NES79345.1 GAF domain-containing protein [Okeania sp. SIO1H4]NET23565.1 GAF domain-containing protein [Okeania sp. SIO1H5]NET78010.1 GAF domain-containing protein [Okeania sp. SIO1F9]NET96452.1 GAF domain-containing protein [Okeania sp. SIO1H2]